MRPFSSAVVHATMAAAVSPTARNPFGIGAYFPPGGSQISIAAELVGRGGWEGRHAGRVVGFGQVRVVVIFHRAGAVRQAPPTVMMTA